MNNAYLTYRLSSSRSFASVYGTCTYSNGTYNNTSCNASTSTGAGNGNSGLVNTGIAVGVVVTLACLILMTAIIVRVWRRSKKGIAQEVTADDEQHDDADHFPQQ